MQLRDTKQCSISALYLSVQTHTQSPPPKSKQDGLTVPDLLHLQLGIESRLRGVLVLPLLELGQTAAKIFLGQRTAYTDGQEQS